MEAYSNKALRYKGWFAAFRKIVKGWTVNHVKTEGVLVSDTDATRIRQVQQLLQYARRWVFEKRAIKINIARKSVQSILARIILSMWIPRNLIKVHTWHCIELAKLNLTPHETEGHCSLKRILTINETWLRQSSN